MLQASNEEKDAPIESKDVESAPGAKVLKSSAELDAPHDKVQILIDLHAGGHGWRACQLLQCLQCSSPH